MDKKIIYLKEVTSYDDIFKKRYNKMPLFIKKLIFLYKNILNIITKKQIEEKEIWILPIKERYYISKIERILKKYFKNNQEVYVLSDELEKYKVYKILDLYKEQYLRKEKIKKALLIKILEYICKIQKKEINNLELTILVNSTSEINMYLIEELAQRIKSLKLVSLNIYKFRNIEEKLYNDLGIAIQFSNTYKKSLEKSEIIINLDFNEIQINEYEINNKAIIINCIDNIIKIKSRLFNGIVINSCNIDFNKEIINKFKQMSIYEDYKKIMLYASLIENEKDICKIQEKFELDKLNITNLVGNNGKISKMEIKNLGKKLDKNKKKE